MASIVKRGKTYAIAYYEGEGKDKHQVWESGLSYTAAKSRKAVIEYEMKQNTHIEHTDITVSEFLYEFIEKYGAKKWVASTYDGNVGLLENYVHPYWGDKKLKNIRTKTVDDLLQSHTARTMLANAEFIIMLNQASTDRIGLAKLLNISDLQMSYITNIEAGHGLIKAGSSLVPFANKFPLNTKLYKLTTTKPNEN